MEPSFWHSKWRRNEIGFHLDHPNPRLTEFFELLALPRKSRVLVPLCGKTLDITWLLSQDMRVVGVELHEQAVIALFDTLGLSPKVTQHEKLTHYSADNLEVWVGNIFDLIPSSLDSIDAIYDRAALVALPNNMRKDYTNHLIKLSNAAKQLVITFEYQQDLFSGPPFSISTQELLRHYESTYSSLKQHYSSEIKGGLKGRYPAIENVWIINN